MKKAASVIRTRVHAPAAVAIHDEQHERQDRSTGVQQVSARQLLRLAVHLAGKLAEGDDGAGEGDCADEDAEEDLDLHDRQFHRRLVSEDGGKACQQRPRRLIERGDMRFFDMGVEADEDGCKTDEGVKGGHKLRHFSHLHAACDEVAENRAACEHQQHDEPLPDALADFRAEDGGDDGEAHACYAVPDGALGAFLS